MHTLDMLLIVLQKTGLISFLLIGLFAAIPQISFDDEHGSPSAEETDDDNITSRNVAFAGLAMYLIFIILTLTVPSVGNWVLNIHWEQFHLSVR